MGKKKADRGASSADMRFEEAGDLLAILDSNDDLLRQRAIESFVRNPVSGFRIQRGHALRPEEVRAGETLMRVKIAGVLSRSPDATLVALVCALQADVERLQGDSNDRLEMLEKASGRDLESLRRLADRVRCLENASGSNLESLRRLADRVRYLESPAPVTVERLDEKLAHRVGSLRAHQALELGMIQDKLAQLERRLDTRPKILDFLRRIWWSVGPGRGGRLKG